MSDPTRPFLIRNDQTRQEYELSDPQVFVDTYKDQGFRIVDPPPTNYGVPEKLPKPSKDAEPDADAAAETKDAPEPDKKPAKDKDA
jgi:hypothetical protein